MCKYHYSQTLISYLDSLQVLAKTVRSFLNLYAAMRKICVYHSHLSAMLLVHLLFYFLATSAICLNSSDSDTMLVRCWRTPHAHTKFEYLNMHVVCVLYLTVHGLRVSLRSLAARHLRGGVQRRRMKGLALQTRWRRRKWRS